MINAATNILIVDDDTIMIQLLAKMLRGVGELRFATNAEKALRLMLNRTPDVLLLDAELPGQSGTSFCKQLKTDPELCDIPVIFVTKHGDPAFEASCLELGAADYVQKPVNATTLLARVQSHLRQKRSSDQLRLSASIDPLTGLANRRALNSMLEREWKHTLRSNQPLSLLLIDIDHFKTFNDHYGHLAGDECIRKVASTLNTSATRGKDVVARYGGEEFIVLLPETDPSGAQTVGDRILVALRREAIPHAWSPIAEYVTASVGASTFTPRRRPDTRRSEPPESLLGPSELLRAADEALYDSKHAGRGCVSYRPLLLHSPASAQA